MYCGRSQFLFGHVHVASGEDTEAPPLLKPHAHHFVAVVQFEDGGVQQSHYGVYQGGMMPLGSGYQPQRSWQPSQQGSGEY